MSIEVSITSNDIISYIVLFTAAFIGGFIGAKMGSRRKTYNRDKIEKYLDKEFPYQKDKVEHRDPRLDNYENSDIL